MNKFKFCVMMALAWLMTSCVDEDLFDIPDGPVSIPSEYIIFTNASQWKEDIVRSGAGAGSTQNRVDNFDLLSDDGEVSLPVGVYVQDGIHRAGEDPATRGAVLTDANLKNFKVWAELSGDDVATDTKSLLYINGAEYSNEARGADKTNVFNTADQADQYLWPGEGTIDFVAVGNTHPDAPVTPQLNAAGTQLESFTYTVPADATKQNDIVVAKANDVDGNLNESVPLTFDHVMSAVNVKIGSMPSSGGEIKSLKFKNIYNQGIYNLTTNSWSREGSKDDYPILDSQGNESYTPGSNGSFINQGEYTFMMLPQTLADDAVLEVVFQYSSKSEVTLIAPIAKNADGMYYEWKKNSTTIYTISIDENYNIQVVSQGNVLDAHYIMTTATVNVTEIDSNDQWYLKVSAENVTSAEDISVKINDGTINQYIKEGYWINAIDGDISKARGGKIVTGTGTGKTNVIIFIPENITANDRKITLEYGIVGEESNAKFEYLYQKAPFWDFANNWGWEKVDDENSGTYGFEWTRKVCYMFAYKIGGIHNWQRYDEDYIRGIINPLIEQFNAEDYVSIDTFKHYVWERSGLGGLWGNYTWKEDGSRVAVIIDYTKLSMDDAASQVDGWSNTKAFFDARNIVAFEDALRAVTKIGEYNDDGTPQTAFRMLETYIPGNGATQSEATCGKFQFDNYTYIDPVTGQETRKMFREFGDLDDASGILKYVVMRNAYDIISYNVDDNNATSILDMKSERIKWYLPAVNQFVNLTDFEFATGNATFNAADFWSSTAASNNQAYIGSGQMIPRSERRKVIVQRKVDEIPTAPTTVTIDNSEMTSGENGSTDVWASQKRRR